MLTAMGDDAFQFDDQHLMGTYTREAGTNKFTNTNAAWGSGPVDAGVITVNKILITSKAGGYYWLRVPPIAEDNTRAPVNTAVASPVIYTQPTPQVIYTQPQPIHPIAPYR